MVPNLAAAMAHSPALIEAFVGVREAYQHTSFSPLEREVLALANALRNGCRYCAAIHATFALRTGLASDQVEALREGRDLADRRLAALVRFAGELSAARGAVDAAQTRAFLAAGFEPHQVLEVIVGLALSTLANYSGHLTAAEPDAVIRPQYR
jgi:uncharacterized peroxidase-related enzyme